MFAYIKGSLEQKSNNFVVIEVAGIGYKVFMPSNYIDKLGNIGDKVKVYTYYYVREDNISLYGFSSNEELRMFELLISVSGIGAKSAIATLSEVSPSSFALSVITNDVSKLTKIPGIGKKTAERLILELKDKLKTESTIEKYEETKSVIVENEKIDEAISALQVLGYSRREVENIIEKIDVEKLELEDIIKQGLKYLAKN